MPAYQSRPAVREATTAVTSTAGRLPLALSHGVTILVWVMLSGQSFKQRAALGTLVLMVIMGAIGCAFFFMALRPCRLDLVPGTTLTYQLRMESRPVLPDRSLGPAKVRTQELVLICIGEDNEMVLINEGRPGQRDEASLLRFAANGTVQRLDAAERVTAEGKALGFFDFNLLQLPEGLEQIWDVDLTYATLPPGRRQVQCRIRRLENGIRPIFRLEPHSTIEWTDKRTGNRYLQIKNLSCRYRFDRTEGLVDQAEIRFVAGRETASGIKRFDVRLHLQLRESVRHKEAQVAALGDLALTTVRAQNLLEDGRAAALTPHLDKLRRAEIDHPRLRRLVAQLTRDAELAGGAVDDATWAVQVASIAADRMPAAEALARELTADGYPAFASRHGDLAVVRVGPYRHRDRRVLTALAERFGHNRPYWVPYRSGE